MGMRIQLQQKMLEKWIGKLDALSPLSILARGYSIARRLPLMTFIKDAGEMQRGDLFHLTLHRGALISRVEEVRAPAGNDIDGPLREIRRAPLGD
ncbi:MAG TPA: hypothetical protein VNV63_04695, partial [Nitrospiria bacterium]|nr:hypothetical protein [Nitrospiria bacterium]